MSEPEILELVKQKIEQYLISKTLFNG